MKKKIQKPFDLKAWKNGAEIETRDGRQVRIVCADAKLNNCDIPQPIFGLITENDEEHTETWAIVGSCFQNNYTFKDDLVIVEEIEEPEKWEDDMNAKGNGWTISKDYDAGVYYYEDLHLNEKNNHDVFATAKQAKSALAMARISQLMANDERYGGVVTEEDWKRGWEIYALENIDNHIATAYLNKGYFARHFLSFHTAEQRELFLKENEGLIKDFLMTD